jgi:hypothetical protein
MHTLEPMFWREELRNRVTLASTVNRPAAPRRPRADAAPPVNPSTVAGSSIPAVFRLIAEFRRQCRASAPREFLRATLNVAIELAHIEFATATRQPRCGGELRLECAECLDDLRGLLHALAAGERPEADQLLHTLDPLIMLLVQADGAIGRSARRATRRRARCRFEPAPRTSKDLPSIQSVLERVQVAPSCAAAT